MNTQPWGASPTDPLPPTREPILKVPPIALALALSMPALFWFQERLPDMGLVWAFYPSGLGQALAWPGVLTAMLLHGSWAHAVFNAVTALCFAPPVARMLPGLRGAGAFLLFYIVCGVIAAVGYGVMNLGSSDPMVGASGAVSGLLGAAIRLIGRPAWAGPKPLGDRRALTMMGVLLAINAVIGLIGYAPGAEGARIAWEAHAFGMVTGYLAIGPLFRWSRKWAQAFG